MRIESRGIILLLLPVSYQANPFFSFSLVWTYHMAINSLLLHNTFHHLSFLINNLTFFSCAQINLFFPQTQKISATTHYVVISHFSAIRQVINRALITGLHAHHRNILPSEIIEFHCKKTFKILNTFLPFLPSTRSHTNTK